MEIGTVVMLGVCSGNLGGRKVRIRQTDLNRYMLYISLHPIRWRPDKPEKKRKKGERGREEKKERRERREKRRRRREGRRRIA